MKKTLLLAASAAVLALSSPASAQILGGGAGGAVGGALGSGPIGGNIGGNFGGNLGSSV